MLVWSFYERPDADAFLHECNQLFLGEEEGPAGGRLERLQRGLRDGRPHLIVLDGLERVQEDAGGGRVRGELSDHTLKLLLVPSPPGSVVPARWSRRAFPSWISTTGRTEGTAIRASTTSRRRRRWPSFAAGMWLATMRRSAPLQPRWATTRFRWRSSAPTFAPSPLGASRR